MITGTGCECTVMSDTRVPLLLCGALVILVLLRDVCVRVLWMACVWGGGGAVNDIGKAGAASLAAALGSGRCGLTYLSLGCKWRVCGGGGCVCVGVACAALWGACLSVAGVWGLRGE